MKLVPNNPPNCLDSDAYQVYFETLPPCIPVGWKLFDVFALDEPEELGGTEIQIGHIETTSKVVQSMYGDTRLFFRHQRFEEDLAVRPHWREWVQEFMTPTFHELLPLPQEAPESCPFEWLFGMV